MKADDGCISKGKVQIIAIETCMRQNLPDINFIVF
jgi:hypothetical protein